MVDSVYIHIPFCKNICKYCDFSKIYYNEKYIDKYLNALEKEIKKRYSNEIINTIYIGGGTPSSLTLKELEKLFSIIKIFKLNKEIEFTFECNIENTTKEKLSFLYKNGVNRLSFGVQSFNPKILKILNRKHNKEQINKVIKLAKEVGFQNINADLIYGLKDQTNINNSQELILVLENLGYKNNDIKKVIPSVNTNNTLEEQIKEALKLMLK